MIRTHCCLCDKTIMINKDNMKADILEHRKTCEAILYCRFPIELNIKLQKLKIEHDKNDKS